MNLNKKLILGSKSPRRQELLKGMGFDFEIRLKEVEEIWPTALKREEIALYLAELKANAFTHEELKEAILITSDTIVWLNNTVLMKPKDYDDAYKILSQLSGNKHEVITAVCLKDAIKMKSFYAVSDVYFKPLTHQEIDFYLQNFSPYDKAGAYGIQEWIGYIAIERIDGSFYNVMGLPTRILYEELMHF